MDNGDNQPIVIVLNDKNEIMKVHGQKYIQKRKPSCFEWIRLLVTISIPIILIIYIIIGNNSNISIIIDNQGKDLNTGNSSRIIHREMDQENALNQMTIVQQNQQNGQLLLTDQQQQNILVEYQMFLANLIIDYGMNLSRKPEAKLVAQFMAVAALKQLDVKRKTILLRTLFDVKLITLQPSDDLWATSVIDLRQVDLSNSVFGLPADVQNLCQRVHSVSWQYLWLPYGILTNASFRCTSLDCAQLDLAMMDSADLSFIYHTNPKCSDPIIEGQTSFKQTSLVRASFYKANIRFTSFNSANLSFANMYGFYCIHCTFSYAVLNQADLSFSIVFNVYVSHPGRLSFIGASFSRALLHSARYLSIDFDQTDWSNAQATQIFLRNCTFTNATLHNCSFMNSNIFISMFENASLRMVDFSNATLQNVSFVNSDMSYADLSSIKCEYCDFINVTLFGAVMKNASFRYSKFVHCDVDMKQLEEVADLSGSTLSNGTVINNNVNE